MSPTAKIPRHRVFAILAFALLLLSLCAPRLAAQFYAPATVFHDPVQRVYPVELARVLAWRENAVSQAGVAEVCFDVQCDAEGGATWTLRWLDASGATLREARVAYPASLLLQGAEFYREVTRQTLAGFAIATPPATSSVASEVASENAFWDGMGSRAMSRLATVRAALVAEPALREQLLKLNPATNAETETGNIFAQHAGRLLASSLSGMTQLFTLDSTLTARGAAWLALGEQTPTSTSAASATASTLTLARPWATVLWLARRQDAAARLWTQATETNAAATSAMTGATGADAALVCADASGTPAQQARDWWNFVLAAPKTHTADETTMRSALYASPSWGTLMLIHASRMNMDYSTAQQCLSLVADIDYQQASDYFPDIVTTYAMDVFQISPIWLQHARRDWLQTINALNVLDTRALAAIPDAQAALAAANAPSAETPSDGQPYELAALIGYTETAPLLRLAYREGAGALEPVATTTMRDILNHGWENAGMNLSRMYIYMANGLVNASQKAPAFQRALLGMIPEFGPFFQSQGWNPALPGVENYDRFQRVERMASVQLFTPIGSPGDPSTPASPNRALALLSRNWLQDESYSYGFWALLNNPAVNPDYIENLVRKITAEGGHIMNCGTLLVMRNRVNAPAMARMPWRDRLEQELTARIPVDCDSRRIYSVLETLDKLPPAEAARKAEHAYWTLGNNPVALQFTLGAYLMAHDIESVARLAAQTNDQILRMDLYMQTYATIAQYSALLHNDLPALRASLAPLARNKFLSSGNLPTDVYYAILQNRPDDALRCFMSIKQNNPSYNRETLTLEYLAWTRLAEIWKKLITALPPERKQLLADYKADAILDSDLLDPWMIARALKLDTEDTIAFITGGRDTRDHRLITACLRYDRDTAEKLLSELSSTSGKGSLLNRMLAEFLYARMTLTQPAPDGKPADWQPVRERLFNAMLQRQPKTANNQP